MNTIHSPLPLLLLLTPLLMCEIVAAFFIFYFFCILLRWHVSSGIEQTLCLEDESAGRSFCHSSLHHCIRRFVCGLYI